MKITPKPEIKTWTDVLTSLGLQETIQVEYACLSGVRGAIYRVKQRFDKDFKTKKINAPLGNLIQITRTK